MNRAAEAAVPEAKGLLGQRRQGHDRGRCLAHRARRRDLGDRLLLGQDPRAAGRKFLPIVSKATEKVALADKYNAVAGKAAGLGLLKARTPTSSSTSPARRWTACT
jgi:hypothetical protein